jgi:hypothetical protein
MVGAAKGISPAACSAMKTVGFLHWVQGSPIPVEDRGSVTPGCLKLRHN